MASLEEVLSTMSEAEDDYLHDDIQFDIDENLRLITVPSKGVVIGVVGDKNVNYVNFRMPRYYNGFDMSTFDTKVSYSTVEGNLNYYDVNDLTVEGDKILFTWLVDSDVTEKSGNITFSVNMIKTENSVIKQAFNTTLATGRVLEGLGVDHFVVPTQHYISDYLTTTEAAKSYLGL